LHGAAGGGCGPAVPAGVGVGDGLAEGLEFGDELAQPLVVVEPGLVVVELVVGQDPGDGLAADFSGPPTARRSILSRMKRKQVAVIVVGVLVVIGVALGLVLSQGSNGPPPLANPSGAGLACTPGRTLADGFYVLENHTDEAVTITGVRLIGGPGQAMTSGAYLTPAGPGHGPLIGLADWPPTAPQWKQRKPAVGGTIEPHTWGNLVFAQTRTSDHPKPAEPEITYTAGGASYTLTERFQTLVAVNCGG
jgi:hypothetical protein